MNNTIATIAPRTTRAPTAPPMMMAIGTFLLEVVEVVEEAEAGLDGALVGLEP
jgi:hypothetical protein